jgi:phospholipid-binding lipoprotein MlaA
MFKRKIFNRFFLAFTASLLLSACASTEAQKAGTDIQDPFESVNRSTFAMNDAVDQAIAEPVARGYRAVIPQPVRMAVRNFLRNIRTPVNAANQALQGDVEGTAADLSRFTINTLIGVGGLFDVAETAGIEYEYEDFGQTLAVWGVDHGPYLVLPILGPSSVRDAAGWAVDVYADPVRLYLDNTDQEEWNYARAGVYALSQREELLDALDSLRKSSIDYYAALRSAYYQKRAALVSDDNPEDAASTGIPDYDDPNYQENWEE